ncbi:MAG: hypothetical protein LBC43_00995 [Bifidobacteriaceae bacterium]|jgi:hypothetical protein|nr:hypothetical protein [Bifidobacteriaceae bacterium]
MTDKDKLVFSMRGILDDEPLGLDNLTFGTLLDFMNDVKNFIKGDSDLETNQIRIALESGSASVVILDPLQAEAAIKDLWKISREQNLDTIDLVRQKTFSKWQSSAHKNSNVSFTMFYPFQGEYSKLDITSETDYKIRHPQLWAKTESYVIGTIYDMGGKSDPNIHLLKANGDTLKVSVSVGALKDLKENYLYTERVLHVSAEENIRTSELRNAKLIEFYPYSPHYDDEDMRKIGEKVSEAWKDVPDVGLWVEQIRGNYAEVN